MPPPALESVKAEEDVEPNVTILPAVPPIDHVVTVVVVPAVKVIVWATVLVLANSLNVLLPVKVSVEVPVVPPIVSLL